MKTLREYIDLVDEELADESVELDEETVEEDAADDVIELSNELNSR